MRKIDYRIKIYYLSKVKLIRFLVSNVDNKDLGIFMHSRRSSLFTRRSSLFNFSESWKRYPKDKNLEIMNVFVWNSTLYSYLKDITKTTSFTNLYLIKSYVIPNRIHKLISKYRQYRLKLKNETK